MIIDLACLSTVFIMLVEHSVELVRMAFVLQNGKHDPVWSGQKSVLKCTKPLICNVLCLGMATEAKTDYVR